MAFPSDVGNRCLPADGSVVGRRLAAVPLRRGPYRRIAPRVARRTSASLDAHASNSPTGFPQELRLGYDASYEPVVLGHTMFVPSMVNDSVTALDTETGAERWQFITGGPVRFAPVASEGKVYFVSDDGYLYCLNADDGSLRWKFRGLPEDRRDRWVLGHGRLVSLWPARGGPVLADGVVYFAAGIWPTEGVFVHAVDAESGKAVWSNTDSDRIPKSNFDHGQGQEAGLTPQGYLAIVGDRLIVPCGTQLPAFLDLKTGRPSDLHDGLGRSSGTAKRLLVRGWHRQVPQPCGRSVRHHPSQRGTA